MNRSIAPKWALLAGLFLSLDTWSADSTATVTGAVPAADAGALAALRRHDFDAVEWVEDGHIHFRIDDSQVELRRFSDDAWLLSWGVLGLHCDPAAINLWNQQTRGSRAYSEEGTLILIESDLLGGDVGAERRIARFLDQFDDTLRQFQVYLLAVCQEPRPAADPSAAAHCPPQQSI